MRFKANRKKLLAAFDAVSYAIPTRSPNPILQNVKLEIGEVSTMYATDLEIGIAYIVDGITAEKPGDVILPTRIVQILKTMNDEEVAISCEDNQILIKAQRSQFKLPSENPDLFPSLDEFTGDDFYRIAADDLRTGIKRTVFATDPQSTRYALGGVLFEAHGNSISMVGTDGRRLALQTVSIEYNGKPSVENVVIPAKALKLIDRNLVDEVEKPCIRVLKQNAVQVRTSKAVIYARLVEGRFPRYQDVFPKECEARIPLLIGPLQMAVEQATIVTSQESRGVDYLFADGLLTLNTIAADSGSSNVEMPIEYASKPISITFDPRFLLDALKVLNPDETLELELIDAKNAAVFKLGDDFFYVLMPLTKDDAAK
ncbi:DnaN DNA polymerase sliding clamp subunit (PCNA homolog) [uncultured Caudovirales phage]|uniref:DnaN DNA polymerase sliding clamp subunit (PCNA homolog) n=1 Tax=uncultured Caudovirales phage TaxID=2100421 RepID=A0A6J5LEG7_9CAUD|nr:DnaN DNA polymerase sliding clamp subunit (PCNA homolog) [uncultured Caudovirales phage]